MKRKQQKNQQELKNLRVRDLTEKELEKIDGGNWWREFVDKFSFEYFKGVAPKKGGGKIV